MYMYVQCGVLGFIVYFQKELELLESSEQLETPDDFDRMLAIHPNRFVLFCFFFFFFFFFLFYVYRKVKISEIALDSVLLYDDECLQDCYDKPSFSLIVY